MTVVEGAIDLAGLLVLVAGPVLDVAADVALNERAILGDVVGRFLYAAETLGS